MIARLWRGQAAPETADTYARHFVGAVCPRLTGISGHRGAWLLRRASQGRIEFLAVTLWDSLDAIRAFAGGDVEAAHVEPEGRAALVQFDTFASHYEVVHTAGATSPRPALPDAAAASGRAETSAPAVPSSDT